MFLKLDGNVIVNTAFIVSVYQKSNVNEALVIRALEEGKDPSSVPFQNISYVKMSDGAVVTSEHPIEQIYKAIASQEKCIEVSGV